MKIHAFFPVGTLRVSRRAILVKLGSLGSLALGAMILTSQGAPLITVIPGCRASSLWGSRPEWRMPRRM